MPLSETPLRRGHPFSPVVVHPAPLWSLIKTPKSFQEALDLQMERHADTAYGLHAAIRAAGCSLAYTTLLHWRRGTRAPQGAASLKAVSVIEQRYRLQPGYFAGPLARGRVYQTNARRAPRVIRPHKLAWHLPHDFETRSEPEKAEILQWVKTHIMGAATAYRRYHVGMARQRFSLNFSGKDSGQASASPRLREEMDALLKFKSASLTDLGYERFGVWGPATVVQRRRHLALMFGALAAPADGPAQGLGAPREAMTLALLAIPEVWDWYVRWRERRRGFYTIWEADMLMLGSALTRPRTGWLRQTPWLASRLRPLPGLVDEAAIARIQADWDGACDRAFGHTRSRAQDVARLRRVHRDPFEAILPILEADNPLGEYRKIVLELVRRMPDAAYDAVGAAETTRAVLMMRFALHLGLRAKNLRQLLLCPPDAVPRSESDLEALGRGELRWSPSENAWAVFIPCSAFKNGNSAYFSRQPFRVLLPDVDHLYRWIALYISRDRPCLLNGAGDPGAFFVKSVKYRGCRPCFTQASFYQTWQDVIQRYGIYNPWTGRGAIPGLKSHGPHNVRDVLATHMLKVTGSYEQAGYAIQDSARSVAAHYARFYPQDKAALAAKVLDGVWTA